MGELHLEIIVDRMLREFKVDANVGKPQVAYRETIPHQGPRYRPLRAPVGGRGQYGHVELEIEPNETGKGSSSSARSSAAPFPAEYIQADRTWYRRPAPTVCSPAIPSSTSKVYLVDGSYHEVDSSEQAFSIAGSMGFRDPMRQAKPVLLEPIMNVERQYARELHGRRHG